MKLNHEPMPPAHSLTADPINTKSRAFAHLDSSRYRRHDAVTLPTSPEALRGETPSFDSTLDMEGE